MDRYAVDMDNNATVANPVEAARIKAGFSLLGLSDATGIPRTSLRRKIQNPKTFTLAELESFAVVVNEDAGELFKTINGAAA